MLVKTDHNKILFYLETKADIEISRSRFNTEIGKSAYFETFLASISRIS